MHRIVIISYVTNVTGWFPPSTPSIAFFWCASTIIVVTVTIAVIIIIDIIIAIVIVIILSADPSWRGVIVVVGVEGAILVDKSLHWVYTTAAITTFLETLVSSVEAVTA